ncbi:MAG: 30S ribosomal protein S9 [Candidatus Kerfeldbacteria bacterium]|nr:30S ribosomal protein S9 [Candidatus Kerfeldbacteria bacterium]
MVKRRLEVKPVSLTSEAIKSEVATRRNGDFISSVGRRKEAVARVWLQFKGSGQITVNDQALAAYFTDPVYQEILTLPLKQLGLIDKFDLKIKVSGGGKQGQAEAVRHAIARVLLQFNEDLRKQLRVAGFLTRDSRVKERKKYGLKKARRAPQWQKR